MKVHTMFVIEKRDMEADVVSVRVHGKGNLGAKPCNEVLIETLDAIREFRGWLLSIICFRLAAQAFGYSTRLVMLSAGGRIGLLSFRTGFTLPAVFTLQRI